MWKEWVRIRKTAITTIEKERERERERTKERTNLMEKDTRK